MREQLQKIWAANLIPTLAFVSAQGSLWPGVVSLERASNRHDQAWGKYSASQNLLMILPPVSNLVFKIGRRYSCRSPFNKWGAATSCIFENLRWNFISDKNHLKDCDHKSTLNNNIEDMFTCIWKQMTFPKECPDRKKVENPGLPKRKRSPKKNPDYVIWFTVNGKWKSALDLTTRIGPWQTNNIYVSQLFTLLQ